jgi:hypothetical protein
MCEQSRSSTEDRDFLTGRILVFSWVFFEVSVGSTEAVEYRSIY